MVAGGIAAGAPALILAPAPSGPSFLLSAGAAAPKFCLAAAADDLQVHLTWVPSASGKDLAIYDGTASDSSKAAKVGTAAGTSALVTGLINGTTYYFWLVVRQTQMSTIASATPAAVPGAPAGLSASPGNARVTLSWAAPASDGGSAVTGYIIYQGTSPGGETGTQVNGSPVTATSYTVAGLTNGTTYYFKAIAVNAVGLSPLSGEASATLPPIVTPSTTPASSATTPTGTAPASASTSAPAFAAPTGLTATPDNAQVRLSWSAPASDGGSPVISYKVYVATAPGVPGSAAVVSTKGTGATVTSLTNGTTYYFMVTAVNAAGNESPFSTGVSAKPAGPARAVTVSLTSPTAPTQLIALLAAAAATAAAAAFTLIARRRRRFRSPEQARSARSDQQTAVAPDVRAVPDTGRPDVVGVRDTGWEPTHTVRLEPHPGVTTTTIKEGRP